MTRSQGRVSVFARAARRGGSTLPATLQPFGELLKEVGRAARLDLKRHFGRPVHLELWVKVREGWSDDDSALRKFGFET